MAAKIIDVDFKEKNRIRSKRIRTKIANKTYNIKVKCKRGLEYIVNHPQECMIVITVASMTYSLGRKVIRDVKPTTNDKMLKRQEYSQYDPSRHVWYELRHKMSNAEKVEFDTRRKNGESVREALEAMRLIK